MTETLVSFKDVVLQTNGKVLFRGLNLEVLKGESLAIVGASGSGKTTLLNAIAGKVPSASGRMSFPYLDTIVNHHRKADPLFNRFRLIANVSSRHTFTNLANTGDLYYQQRFNSTDSEDTVTVAQYLQDAANSGVDGVWTVPRAIDTMNLHHLASKQLIKLSNGETKRLRIAAALVRNPALLLLDQPLTGLDKSARQQFNKLICEIALSGITTVLATSPDEVPAAIANVAVIADHTIRQIIPAVDFRPEEFLTRPQKIYFPGLSDLLKTYPRNDFKVIAEMSDVNIVYGDRQILKVINWTIKKGERWMLTGANGAGKSTLLSLIAGDNPQAFSQKITLFDRRKGSGESIWEIKRKIGFVSPELFQYFPTGITCIQAVESGFYDTLGLFRKSSPDKYQICERWLKVLGIQELAGVKLGQVPVSVQRLVLLARSLVKSPALLILDEPGQALDRMQHALFKSLIDEICRQTDLSLIYVSHYPEDMPLSIDRYVHLEEGMITSIGEGRHI